LSIYCGTWWTRTTPVRTKFTVSLPYPNDFQFPIQERGRWFSGHPLLWLALLWQLKLRHNYELLTR
jgi:hypothetical protein